MTAAEQGLPIFRTEAGGFSRTLLGEPVRNTNCGNGDCYFDCQQVFSRLSVTPSIHAETRVEWLLHPQFDAPEPYSFRLQFGRTGLARADDWVDVGDPVTSAVFLLDTQQRVFGKFQWTHYRVLLTDGNGVTYVSPAQSCLGKLSKQEWLQVREIKRREHLRLKAEAGVECTLLKRRHFGPPCECRDPLTQEVRDPGCTTCYGTGFVHGYFQPYPCFYVELGLDSFRGHLDGVRGSVDIQTAIIARTVNDPQLFNYDIVVQPDSDIRWRIDRIDSLVEMRGLPVVISMELRQLPFSHVIYQLPV